MANLEEVTAGELLAPSASDWNAAMRMIKANRLGGSSGAGELRSSLSTAHQVLIRNDTGEDLDRFHIAGLGDPVFTPSDSLAAFTNNFAFQGVAPDEAYRGKIAITSQPIASGKIGQAYIDGIVPCRVNVTNEIIDRADMLDEDVTQLETSLVGACQIVWKESGTGTKWCLVRLQPPQDVNLWGKASGTIAANSEGTVRIWRNGIDTGIDLVATLATFDGNQAISDGKEVGLKYYAYERKIRIVHADCED